MEKAKILEELIKQQGMNARSFAEKCGLPYTTVYTILKNGAGKANVNNVIAMCKTLGITVEQLDEMSKGVPTSTYEPTYEDVELLIARGSKGYSTEQKMKLIKMLSELD